jgi:ankyrin repeat protein
MQLLEINPSLVRHFPDEDLNMDFRSTPQPALWLLDTMPNTHMSVNMQNHSAPQSPFGVDALSGILLSMLRDSEVADTFIVIDGLDEFDQGALQLVYRLLGDLINIANKRVCLTFRSRDDISDELHRVVNRERCCYLQIDTGHGFNADIRSCTQRLLDSLTKQRNLPSELLDEIKRLVSSSGRFADAYLWRMLLFQVLERLPTLKIIRTFLKKLQTESSPSQTKLEALYSASFDCLVEKSDQTSMAILCFSALARRSLTLEELSCLLVAYKQNLVEEQRKQSTDVSLDTEAHFDLDGLDNGKLLHIEDWICSELFGFLVIKAGVVSLIHSSARRAIIAYLKQRGTCQQREKDFTAACLLLMALLRRSGKVITYDGKTHTPSVDFLGYAIGNWHVHLKNAGSEAKNIHYLVEEVWCNEQLRPLLLEFTNRKHPRVSQLTLPCVLAALDLSENLRLSVTPHARARDSPLQLPMELRFAVANNSVEAFEVLKGIYRLEMGFLDENGQNLMDYAVWAGSVELADMLAKYGIKATKSSDAYVKAVEKHPDFEKVYNLKVFSNPGTSIFRSEVFLSAVSQGNDAIIQLAIQYNSFDAAVIQRALEKAVDTQQFSTVEILLGHRKQRNLTSEVNLATCLCKAANRANLPITQKLLDDGANSNEHDIHGVSPLHFGAQSGRLEIVELLVEARARKSAIDNKGQKPIHWAARRGHSSIVEYLISPPNDIDMFGRSALSLACKNGSFPTISILLEYGAGVNKKDRSGRTALHEAATSGSREMVKLLLEKGANPYLASKREMTPLHEAARKGWFSVAQELLAFTGSDLVNLPDIDKKTPLHYACLSRNPSARLVQLLLDLGAKPNAVDKEEKTALHMAAKYGNVATVELLIKKYATIHLKDMYGMTPLHYAAKKGRTDVVVSLLTRASTDLDSGAQSGEGSASNPISMYQDNFGRTPLHYAVETHSYKLVGRLLEAYKGPHLAEFLAAKDNQGMRALDLVDSGRTSPSGVVKLLKEAESNLTAVSEAAPEQISLEKSE